MQASSSLRESRSETRRPVRKTVGCMAGILHFISRHHHSRSQKRLTSAKEKDKTVTSPSRSEPPPKQKDAKKKNGPIAAATAPDLRRSPTIPAEIRRPSSAAAAVAPSPESPRRPPALVARLMGLEEIPAAASPESAAEKRRRLLGALEKCDEDLKALKRIIEAVRFAEIRVKAVSAAIGSAVNGGDGLYESERVKSLDVTVDQPSPVSVLDAITSPRFRSRRFPNEIRGESGISAVGSRIVKPSRMGVLFVGDRDNCGGGQSWSFLGRRIGIEGLPRMPERREGEILQDGGRHLRRPRRRQRSQAMVESVGEVWEDGEWEERWELGRVGVRLEVDIFGDLVEEVVVDIMGCHYEVSLPIRRWRKRLCF